MIKPNCKIENAVYQNGIWFVHTVVSTESGTRSGTHQVELGEDASVEDLEAVVLALYE